MKNFESSRKVNAIKKEEEMSKLQLTKRTTLSVSRQQNLIELLEYIFDGRYSSLSELMFEFFRGRRTVYRMLTVVNPYGAIISSLDLNFRTTFSFNRNLSEKELDRVFEMKKDTPLVYLYLKSLIRELNGSRVNISEIQEIFACTKRQAISKRNQIFEAAHHGDFEVFEGEEWY